LDRDLIVLFALEGLRHVGCCLVFGTPGNAVDVDDTRFGEVVEGAREGV
jgi:hypothetical protein